MAPTASWQSPNVHEPNYCPQTICTLSPRTLGQTQSFEAVFDAWPNAVPSELQLSSSYTDLTPPSLSDYDYVFLPTPELSPSPTIQTHLHAEPIANAVHENSGIDEQIFGLQAPRKSAKLSTSSCDIDCPRDESDQRLSCSECTGAFGNLSALDKHTQSTSHKAWRCAEAGCEKTYARRDTFLRHRVAHRDDALNHVCLVCSQFNKSKVFRRKDHLRDHMRKCHLKNVESRRSSHDSCTTGYGSDCSSKKILAESQVSTPVQKQAMKELVKSLGTVLGERNKSFIGDLEDKMTALSGPDMESVAQGMAGVALAKTYFSNSNDKRDSI